jgi:hypothetical protein
MVRVNVLLKEMMIMKQKKETLLVIMKMKEEIILDIKVVII